MSGTNVDWTFHKANYAKNFAERLTVAEYARQQGLNVNTARRAMKGAGAATGKDSSSKSDAPKQSNKQKKQSATPAKKDAATQSLARAKRVVSAKARELAAETRREEIAQADRDHSEGDHPAGDHPQSDHHERSPATSSNQQPARKTITYTPTAQGGGHASDHLASGDHGGEDRELTRQSKDMATTFGGYASLVNLPEDVFAAASMLAQDDGDLMLSSGRYLQMYKTQQTLLTRLKDEYAADNPWKDDAGNPIPYTQAEYQLIFGCSQRMTELESSLGRRKMGAQKLELERRAMWREDQERHPTPLAVRLNMTRDIMQLREENELSAIEAARLLESHGLELPKSLQAEMLREVSWLEAPTDTTGGVTDDELEVMSREYLAAQAEIMAEWLPTRRAEFEALMAEEVATQQGDTLDEEEFSEDDVEPAILADDPDSDVQESW